MTYQGGNMSLNGGLGDGTVFSMRVGGGTPTALFSFDGTHGANPTASLTLSPDGSALYGMTYQGGNMSLNGGLGDGTVFSMRVGGGTPTPLFSFDGTHGTNPVGSLILSPNGSTLYGVAQEGGSDNDGTVFSMPVGGGTQTTLFNFDGTHGANPSNGLMLIGSTLYGMTYQGGNMSLNGGLGDGTVFSMPVGGGTPTTLFNFDGTHGANPLDSLILSHDGSTFYGVTLKGGTNGVGTVFSMPVGGGTPTTLFSFDGTHGTYPVGSLILSPNGSTLYGMTSGGGNMSLNGGLGDGTVFSMPVGGGTPTRLFTFDGTNGESPWGSLILSGSTLYGMTHEGGTNGDGTVFALHLLPGDADNDGMVDINDLTVVLSNFGKTGMTWSKGEFTGDGTVDINDLTIVLANFDTSSGAGITAVPEPSCVVLLGIGAISLVAFAKRRRAS